MDSEEESSAAASDQQEAACMNDDACSPPEIIVFRVKTKPPENTNFSCTETFCTCDDEEAMDNLKEFCDAVLALVKHREKMCPNVVHEFLNESNMFGVGFRWLDVGLDSGPSGRSSGPGNNPGPSSSTSASVIAPNGDSSGRDCDTSSNATRSFPLTGSREHLERHSISVEMGQVSSDSRAPELSPISSPGRPCEDELSSPPLPVLTSMSSGHERMEAFVIHTRCIATNIAKKLAMTQKEQETMGASVHSEGENENSSTGTAQLSAASSSIESLQNGISVKNDPEAHPQVEQLPAQVQAKFNWNAASAPTRRPAPAAAPPSTRNADANKRNLLGMPPSPQSPVDVQPTDAIMDGRKESTLGREGEAPQQFLMNGKPKATTQGSEMPKIEVIDIVWSDEDDQEDEPSSSLKQTQQNATTPNDTSILLSTPVTIDRNNCETRRRHPAQQPKPTPNQFYTCQPPKTFQVQRSTPAPLSVKMARAAAVAAMSKIQGWLASDTESEASVTLPPPKKPVAAGKKKIFRKPKPGKKGRNESTLKEKAPAPKQLWKVGTGATQIYKVAESPNTKVGSSALSAPPPPRAAAIAATSKISLCLASDSESDVSIPFQRPIPVATPTRKSKVASCGHDQQQEKDEVESANKKPLTQQSSTEPSTGIRSNLSWGNPGQRQDHSQRHDFGNDDQGGGGGGHPSRAGHHQSGV